MRRGEIAVAVMALSCAGGTARAETKPSAADRLLWSGDLRLRSELMTFTQDVAPGASEEPTEFRGRFRLRLGVERRFGDSLTFVARVATGSSNPTSGNVSFGDLFGKKAIGLDRVYLAFRPSSYVSVVAGKMENPTFDRDLLWDGDVGPEGVAERFAYARGDLELAATAAQLVMADLDETSADPWLYVGQLAGRARVATVEIETGVAYYHYTNLDEFPLPYAQGTNSHDADGVLTVDYHVLAGLVAMRATTAWLPVVAHVELSQNLAVERAGRGIGTEVRIGENRGPRDWSAGYAYQRLERDATLDSLAESQWHKQRTNYRGHAVNAKLSLRSYWIVSTSLKLMRSIAGPRDDEFRWTLDTIVTL
jgi:hypothetical protein